MNKNAIIDLGKYVGTYGGYIKEKDMKLKFCMECKWSIPEEHCEWNLRCINKEVNAKDELVLSSAKVSGTNCRAEREKPWLLFPACGKAGKLWEQKIQT